jgi:hypothetical protein
MLRIAYASHFSNLHAPLFRLQISVGAILRPQSDELLKGFEKRMIG